MASTIRNTDLLQITDVKRATYSFISKNILLVLCSLIYLIKPWTNFALVNYLTMAV